MLKEASREALTFGRKMIPMLGRNPKGPDILLLEDGYDANDETSPVKISSADAKLLKIKVEVSQKPWVGYNCNLRDRRSGNRRHEH